MNTSSDRTSWSLPSSTKARNARCICRPASGCGTGRASTVAGGRIVVADARIDAIPVWVRAGAVVPKIPEDVMTLVPPAESGNTTVKSLDNRRVYEVIGSGPGESRTTDFEGRTILRRPNSLTIAGSAARVTVRWRFGLVGSATVNGAPAKIEVSADGPSVTFDHATESSVEWKEGVAEQPAAASAPPPTAEKPAPAKTTTHRHKKHK